MNDNKSSSETVTAQRLVTEDHIRAVLIKDKGESTHLTAWKIVDFLKKGKNFACIVTTIEVKYMLDGQNYEVIYVVKLHPCAKMESRLLFNDVIFEKETKFYNQLIPELNSVLKRSDHREIHFPKCLHASHDEGKQMIILEDLRPQGYRMHDDRCGMDKTHATLVLRELARLHAASLLLQNKRPDQDFIAQHPYIKKDWYYLTHANRGMLDLFENSLTFAKEILIKEEGYEKVPPWIDNIIPNIVDIFYKQLECGEPKVVCHGDCCNNNLLFRYSDAGQPKDVMLLDLQLVHYSTPAADLNFFLFTNMNGDVRKLHTESLLDSYYTAFSDIMEDAGQRVPFTQPQLLKDYRDKNLTGVIFGAIIIPLLAYEFGDAIDSSMASEETPNWIYSKKREKLAVMLNSDLTVKQRFLSLFSEIMETGLIQ